MHKLNVDGAVKLPHNSSIASHLGRKMFNIIAINERRGWSERVNATPMTHSEACAMLKKFTPHRARRLMLVPA